MKKTHKHYRWRFIVVFVVVLLGFMVLLWRMFDLMVVEHHFLLRQGDARTIRVVKVPAYRGMILDRQGEPLAISTPVSTIWINPKEYQATSEQFNQLVKLLDLDPNRLQRRLKRLASREFMYVQRQINPLLADKVMALGIPGVHLKHEFKRYYPEGEVTSQVVGFTNIDDKGQEGLELEYNHWLHGASGSKRVLVDRYGRIVSNIQLMTSARPGHNLTLSIDSRIQYLAYRTLKRAVNTFNAKSGTVVVLDVKTGEILAMVNQPSFNPNDRTGNDVAAYRNRAVTDVFEPGSTLKAFSVANALLSGKYQPDSKVDTSPGWMMVQGNRVDDEKRNLGIIDLTTILQRSSNVGVTKLTLSLPPKSLPTLLHTLGFGEQTNVKFPGESPGYFPYEQRWQPFALATLSFGYGLSVTALQLAQAYGVIAADGIKRPLTLLKRNKPAKEELIFSPSVAKNMQLMLESVVSVGGTATRAQVPGYRVAGKTGTVRIVGPNGYEKNHHIGLFVGMAPVSHPRLVVAVVIRDPRGGVYYGGLVSAPVFSRVMSGALRLLDVPPDNLPAAVKRSG